LVLKELWAYMVILVHKDQKVILDQVGLLDQLDQQEYKDHKDL
jgi:hypothetical protein